MSFSLRKTKLTIIQEALRTKRYKADSMIYGVLVRAQGLMFDDTTIAVDSKNPDILMVIGQTPHSHIKILMFYIPDSIQDSKVVKPFLPIIKAFNKKMAFVVDDPFMSRIYTDQLLGLSNVIPSTQSNLVFFDHEDAIKHQSDYR